MITADRLKELLDYDEITGVFRWRVHQNNAVPVGKVAGSLHKSDGYIHINVDFKRYPAHTLAWLYMTGEWRLKEIDHIDRNGSNNAIRNLRVATWSQNQANHVAHSNNRLGVKGVRLCKSPPKYLAYIKKDGKRLNIGYFDDIQSAAAAYAAKAKELFGEFARTA